MKYKYFFYFSVLFLIILCSFSFANASDIYVVNIDGAITPGSSYQIQNSIKKAEDNNAACLIIKLNTPGGLVSSTRKIVMSIYQSKVPIVVYVAPSGARAASAGVMITMAADIAAMAPGTHIGAAHPILMGGGNQNNTKDKNDQKNPIMDKITNDMAAYAKSIAKKRGRNEIWAEKAVRDSVSIDDSSALKENVINIIAKNIDDLIKQINGKQIQGKGILDLKNSKIVNINETLKSKILKAISNPNIAYILLMIGIAGLYFEFSNPGAIFPGVIGGISLLLACYSLYILPINQIGILFIILAIILFIIEMKITSYGLLSVAGVISIFMGSIMLFDNMPNIPDAPELQLSWSVLLPTIALISAFFIVIAALVFRTHLSQVKTGADGLIGEIGVVKEILDNEGKVLVHGELWKAISENKIDVDKKVTVTKVNNLQIFVKEV